MGRSYDIPEDVDESDLMAELDALEADMSMTDASKGEVPSYLQVGWHDYAIVLMLTIKDRHGTFEWVSDVCTGSQGSVAWFVT